jgi:dipeptidyl aminopeptidase/acylaminoacyl peptidase
MAGVHPTDTARVKSRGRNKHFLNQAAQMKSILCSRFQSNKARHRLKLIRHAFLATCAFMTWLGHGYSASAGLQIPHPDDASKQVEYFVEKPPGKGPWPTVVLLHGGQEWPRPGGKDFVTWGVLQQFAKRGYLAVAVSQPGYGNSTGPADFCGPYTQHAVTAVIVKLRADGQASAHKLLIEGISRGALTAGLVAAHDRSVSGLVLISGVFDLPAYVAATSASSEKLSVVKALMAETGGTADALNARSVLRFASSIKAKSLILNGAKDDRTNPGQATSLAEQITRSGGNAKAIIYPDFGHKIPVDVRNQDIDPFIDSVLRNADDF